MIDATTTNELRSIDKDRRHLDGQIAMIAQSRKLACDMVRSCGLKPRVDPEDPLMFLVTVNAQSEKHLRRARRRTLQRYRAAFLRAHKARSSARSRVTACAPSRIGRQSRGRRVQRNVTKKLAAKASTADPDGEPPRRSACAPTDINLCSRGAL